MITITRLLARQFRAVFRRARIVNRGPTLPICISAGAAGVCISAHSLNGIVEHREPGQFPAEQLVTPFELLSACEGSQPDAVTLEQKADGKVQAAWNDRGVPQVVEYDVHESQREITQPVEPATWKQVSAELLHALHEAKDTTADQSVRYALDYIQLRGETGEIIATDTHQLLVQLGFEFPWPDDVLIPATSVFRSPEFAGHDRVEIGKTDNYVVVRVGAWQVYLLIEKERRFPKVDDLIPSQNAALTRLMLDPQDAAFLQHTIPRLPAADSPESPVTLDLNGHIAISAKAVDQARVTELLLSRSTYTGEPVRLRTDRRFLQRAAGFGFTEIFMQADKAPLLCEDARRKYIWQPFEAAPKYDAGVEITRIESTQASPSPARTPQAPVRPLSDPVNRSNPIANRSPRMSRNRMLGDTSGQAQTVAPTTPATQNEAANGTNTGNGHVAIKQPVTNGSQPGSSPNPESNQVPGFSDPIREAECLKDILRSVLVRANRLVKALRRQKKQARLVESTLASLRQLQNVS